MQFARVLDEDDTLIKVRHFGEERIGERRLSRRGAARDENVFAFDDGEAQQSRRLGGHDAVFHVVGEGIDLCCGFADREAGRDADRREHAFEALARPFAPGREFRRDNRRERVNLGARVRCDKPDDALDLRGIETHARVDPPLAEPVDPNRAVRVHHDFLSQRVGERCRDRRSHRAPQHRALAAFGNVVCRHSMPPAEGVPSVRRPLAIASPTRATKVLKRSRPTARDASSASGSGACTISS